MSTNNPIDFNDLFNFSDQSTIEKGINGINQLKKTYTDFFNSVIGGQLQRLTEQEAQLVAINEQLLKSTQSLSVANKTHQQSLLDNLKAAEGLKSQQAALNKSRQDAKKTDEAATTAVKSLTQQYSALKRAYEAAMLAGNDGKAQKIAADARAIDNQIRLMNTTLKESKQVFTAAAGSYAALDAENKKLIADLKQMPNGLAATNKEAKALQAQIFANTTKLKEFDATINQNFRNVGNYKSALSGLGNQFSQFALGYLSIQAGFALLGSIFKANEAIGESLVVIRQKASLTADETDRLEESLKRIKSSTSLQDLAELTAIGARRGIKKEDLVGFAEGLDLVNKALAGQIEGGAEGLATALTRINALFNVTGEFGVKEGIIKTGAALSALGKYSITTDQNLQDFAVRTAGVAKVFQLTLPQVLAYGSAFQEAGVEAEKSGTAFNKLLLLLAGKKEKYFAIAQLGDATLNLKDFTNLINTDADAALKKFFVGLTSGNATATDMADRLKDLGLKAGDVTRAVIGLAQNQDKLKVATDLANNAFKDGNEIYDQAAIKNETLQGKTDKLVKSFTNATTSGAISNFFKQIVDGARYGIEALDGLFNSRSFKELSARVLTLNGGDIYDKINSIDDNFKNSQTSFSKAVSSNGLDLKANGYPNGLQGKSPEQLKATLKDFQKAYGEAYTAYSQYYDGIQKGLVIDSDDGVGRIEKVKKNARDIETAMKYVKNAYDAATKAAEKTGKAQLTGSGEAPDSSLKSIPQIQARIKELTAKPDSGVLGSETNKRIIALRDRLKELHGITIKAKDGFAALESEVDKLTKKLEDRILKGDKVAQNDPLIVLLRKKVAELNAAKEAYQNLINGPAYFPLPKSGPAPDLNDPKLTSQLDAQQTKLDYKKDAEDAEKSLGAIATKTAQYNAEILRQYKNATITKIQYDALALASASKEANESYFAEKVALNARLQLAKEGSIEQLYLLKQIADLDAKYSREQIKNAEEVEAARIKGIEKIFGAFNKSLNAISKSAGPGYTDIFKTLSKATEEFAKNQKLTLTDAFELAGGLADGFTQVFVDGSNQRIAQLGIERDNSLTIAGNNAAAKRTIEKKYNDELAVEKTKQAKAEKLNALFQIAVSTAVAVVQALTAGPVSGEILAGIVAALGAAELALVAAKPIPKYFMGRNGGPEEYAVVNDRGTEILEHQGKFRIAGGGKETITKLRSGEKVHTAEASLGLFEDSNMANQFLDSLIKGTDIVRNHNDNSNKQLIRAFMSQAISEDKLANAFSTALNNRPVHETHIDADGWREFEVTTNMRIQKQITRRSGGNG